MDLPIHRRLRKPSFRSADSSARLVACSISRIKGFPDAGAGAGRQSAEQGASGDSQHRMSPVGCDLEQRHEHEGAPMHLGMRQYDATALAPAGRPAEPPGAMIQHVDIESPGSPMAPEAPSRLSLDLFRQPQHSRGREPALQHQNRVEISRLPARPERSGRVNLGCAHDAQAGARQSALRACQSCARWAPRTRHVCAERKNECIHVSTLDTSCSGIGFDDFATPHQLSVAI